MDRSTKEKLVRVAMEEAQKAIDSGNSPFGAILIDSEGNIIGSAHNTSNTDSDPTAHAEINLIRKVSKKLKSKDLSKYTLVCNANSCSMCFSAAIKAKIRTFVFGAGNESRMDPYLDPEDISKHSKNELSISEGILKEECEKQISGARENSN